MQKILVAGGKVALRICLLLLFVSINAFAESPSECKEQFDNLMAIWKEYKNGATTIDEYLATDTSKKIIKERSTHYANKKEVKELIEKLNISLFGMVKTANAEANNRTIRDAAMAGIAGQNKTSSEISDSIEKYVRDAFEDLRLDCIRAK